MPRDLLNREIIKRFMSNVGISPYPNFGSSGLSDKSLIDKKLITEDEDGKKEEHDIYVGEIKEGDNYLRGLLVDLSDSLSEFFLSEFLLIIQLNNFPIYSLRLVVDDIDNGQFLICSSGEQIEFQELDVYAKALALAASEAIAHSGALWQPCEKYDDLYAVMLELVQDDDG